jgi:hypothetical protein
LADVLRNRPRVVDVWRELDVEILKSGSTTLADNSWIEPEAASEIVSMPKPTL